MAELRNSLPQGLLNDVKNALDVTWQDTAVDDKYKMLIANGIMYLDGKLGIDDLNEYTKDGNPRTLLLEYVRYARDNALEVFENNFQALLLGAQNERRVTYVIPE